MAGVVNNLPLRDKLGRGFSEMLEQRRCDAEVARRNNPHPFGLCRRSDFSKIVLKFKPDVPTITATPWAIA